MRNKKNRIFFGVLTAVFCVVLSVGITLAFFSETLAYDNNKVKAGKLKVDLEVLDKDDPTKWISIKDDS